LSFNSRLGYSAKNSQCIASFDRPNSFNHQVQIDNSILQKKSKVREVNSTRQARWNGNPLFLTTHCPSHMRQQLCTHSEHALLQIKHSCFQGKEIMTLYPIQ
jgi:hypothetical protein